MSYLIVSEQELMSSSKKKNENISWHHRQFEDIIKDIHSMLNSIMAQGYSRFVINSQFFYVELELRETANEFYFTFPFCFG